MTPIQIATLRKQLGLSQTQFAQLLGVHSMTVSRWERPGSSLAPSDYHRALMGEFFKAAHSRTAARHKETLGALLVGGGVIAVLLLLLNEAKGK